MIRHCQPICLDGTHRVGRLLLALFSSNACAQAAEPGVSTGMLLQTILALVLVIGVLFLAAYLLRKLNGGRGFGSSGPLRVVGGLMIGTRERIVLVEIGDTWIVVGLVPGQIRTLHTLPKGDLKPAGDGERHFAQWLKQITERKNEGG
ncbi:flagellar biosynthetic protein FliO [Candidatus Accumulibacter phosphatis]|nr:flagellar biosynthetic protein FliO [Accumulibacter sp.]NMQ07787.1 flagellar biosynthetic protein FliO [Candidatus Accumulibacter contiguus]